MALAAGNHAKGAGMAIQHNDPALQAATYGSAIEAKANLQNDFRKSDGSFASDAEVDAAIGAVKASGGFGRARQVFAAQQLAATGTGYAEGGIDQVAKTIARVSHGNPETMASLVGNINSSTKSVGRHDLAPGYNDLLSLAEGESKGVAGNYAKAAETAWNSGTLYQHANDKPQNIKAAINHFTPLLSSTDEAQRENAAVFFNEIRSIQPNASGDVKNHIQQALEDNRDSINALFDTTGTTAGPLELPATPFRIADRPVGQQEVMVPDASGNYTRTVTPPTAIARETAKQRVERKSRTYERPDPNNIT
jgi:hypothetical protein